MERLSALNALFIKSWLIDIEYDYGRYHSVRARLNIHAHT
ncbi:hypothetical protein K661_02377 [Piscirickettsia salmonis LF-89 = ATCC VR-1361]|nr:hypothetical protein K661_02377 [Piscirickettsia salmonis LF-89 = ATCC VR-1361]